MPISRRSRRRSGRTSVSNASNAERRSACPSLLPRAHIRLALRRARATHQRPQRRALLRGGGCRSARARDLDRPPRRARAARGDPGALADVAGGRAASEIPALGAMATARSVARLYANLTRLLSGATIEVKATTLSRGWMMHTERRATSAPASSSRRSCSNLARRTTRSGTAVPAGRSMDAGRVNASGFRTPRTCCATTRATTPVRRRSSARFTKPGKEEQ